MSVKNNIVKIYDIEGQSKFIGNGILINIDNKDHSYIFTARHIFTTSYPVSIDISKYKFVLSSNNQEIGIKNILYKNQESSDLLILICEKIQSERLCFNINILKNHSYISLIGFPNVGNAKYVSIILGKILDHKSDVDYLTFSLDYNYSEELDASIPKLSDGMSGSPIIDSNDKIIGIFRGTSDAIEFNYRCVKIINYLKSLEENNFESNYKKYIDNKNRISDDSLKIGVYSYCKPPISVKNEYNLDLSEYFKKSLENIRWVEITKDLIKFKKRIVKKFPKRNSLIINGKAHLSLGFFMGFLFCETTGYQVLANQYDEIWGNFKSQSFRNWRIQEQNGNIEKSENIIIIINIGNNKIRDQVNHYLVQNKMKYAKKISYTYDERIEKEEISSLLKEIVKELKSHIIPKGIFHLFSSIPLGFAILLGYHFNTLIPIQLYEYNKEEHKYYLSFLINHYPKSLNV